MWNPHIVINLSAILSLLSGHRQDFPNFKFYLPEHNRYLTGGFLELTNYFPWTFKVLSWNLLGTYWKEILGTVQKLSGTFWDLDSFLSETYKISSWNVHGNSKLLDFATYFLKLWLLYKSSRKFLVSLGK